MEAPHSKRISLTVAPLLLGAVFLAGCNDGRNLVNHFANSDPPPCEVPAIWREINMGPSFDNAHAFLWLKWHDRKLYYNFSISATRVVKAAVDHPVRQMVSGNMTRFVTGEFDILLLDAESFKLVQIKLPVTELVQELAGDETEGRYLVAGDSIDCSHELYCSIRDWNLEWRLVGARL